MDKNERLLTITETAAFLNISQSSFRSKPFRVRLGIPYIRVGRSIRYRMSDIEQFIENNRERHEDDGSD